LTIELTIIVPSYNRPDRLHRALSYWCQSDWEVIVADGSELSNEVIAGEFKVSKYLWDNKSSLVDRWISAINQVESEFLLICADDDFVGFDACEKCVSYLKSYPTASSAQGLYLGFDNSFKCPLFYPYYNFYRKPFFDPLSKSYPLFEYNQSAISERIFNGFRYYHTLMYSVQRTSNVKKGLINFPKLTNDNPFEIQFNFLNLMFGKSVILPIFYGVRESIIGSAGSSNACVTDWIENDPVSFNEWRNFCVAKFVGNLGLSHEGGQDLFEIALLGYKQFVEELCQVDTGGITGLNKILSIPKNLLKSCLPGKLIAKIREKNVKKRTGMEPDLVQLARNLYGEDSVPDAMRIQQAILGSDII